MSIKKKKAVLFVPFWRMAGHVGNTRVDRFLRWLSDDGYELVIIRAGTHEGVRNEPWGQEITIVDRLGLHPEALPGQAKAVSHRKPNNLRRALAYWIFNPDPAVVWAKAAARHPKVAHAMQDADFILSSSPPESAHVGAWMLSKKFGVPHIMDMRDGWLDEPLKPLLHSSALRRWQERRLESCIAHDAKAIQVTSDVWEEMFDARYPQLVNKVHVLTNGYPAQMPPVSTRVKGPDEELLLIHAGRFTGSHLSRTPDLLLTPLLKHLSHAGRKGSVHMYGDLSADELAAIEMFQPQFEDIGWYLECVSAVPRSRMLEILQEADGLLLLSASHAALPSKLFEYIATGKRILYVTGEESASHRILMRLPQAVNLQDQKNKVFADLAVAKTPVDFSEPALREKFLRFSDV